VKSLGDGDEERPRDRGTRKFECAQGNACTRDAITVMREREREREIARVYWERYSEYSEAMPKIVLVVRRLIGPTIISQHARQTTP
jgi:hypothetical protein